MAALVKANATMLAGNPQLTTYNVSTASDGALSVSAQFVVLSQFAASVFQTFRIGSNLHSQLRAKADVVAALQNYKASAFPVLVSAEITTSGGLSTIDVSYAGESLDDPGTDNGGEPIVTREITTSTDLRSLSGSVVQTLADGTTQNLSFSFDYYATSVTAEGGSSASPRELAGAELSAPFNVRAAAGISIREIIEKQEIRAQRTYRNNLGQFKSTTTVTPIYVQAVESI